MTLSALIAADDENRYDELMGIFGLPGATFARNLEQARLRTDLSAPAVIVLDARLTWAGALVQGLPERAPAVLVVADVDTLSEVPWLLRSGADAFVALPAPPRVASAAVEAAIAGRARRSGRTARHATSGGPATTAELNEALQRERERGQYLAQAMTRLERSYLQTVRKLAIAVDIKDPSTSRPIERVSAVAEALARRVDPDVAGEPFLAVGFLLHDLGEIGVPEHVLLKPGPLSPTEQAAMQEHAVIGAEIVSGIELLAPVAPIIRHHHERWDGLGYPDGLKGDAIPAAARVFAVADAADAMLHDRPYRSHLTIDLACDELARGAGSQFDPDVVEAFLSLVGTAGNPFAA